MFAQRRISKAFHEATELIFTDRSRIVIMSDCHRGDGSYADNFAHNQNLFFAALTQYNHHKYTYIELGDGDELWEIDKMSRIMDAYDNVFWLLSKFHRDSRLYMMIGNHDIVKGKNGSVRSQFLRCVNSLDEECNPLFPDIHFYESLLLRHAEKDLRLFLLHGHQADFLNYRLWRLARFLVRYLWRPLELIGIKDPTSAASNPKRKRSVERKLIRWVNKESQPLISGHTHRAIFPKPEEPCYFNDGSCVHPRCITALEIADGSIMLVKWSYRTKFDGTVYVGREVLEGPEDIELFCSKHG